MDVLEPPWKSREKKKGGEEERKGQIKSGFVYPKMMYFSGVCVHSGNC